MSDLNYKFLPSDFTGIISYDELVQILEQQIISIRNQDSNKQILIKNIQILQEMDENKIYKSNNLTKLLEAYEQIKKVSMELRRALSPFVKGVQIYKNIEYTFYYDGKRYVTNEIKVEWLEQNSKHGLRLDLEKATQDLQKQYNNLGEQKFRELFNQHYVSYLAAIEGMHYNNSGYKVGQRKKGNKLNRGHIAEAYEEHLQEHHPLSYPYLNNFTLDNVALRGIIAIESKELNKTYWEDHETATEAWKHIRSAKGNQRGTVAGDVGERQIKQGNSFGVYNSIVRLSSITNLKRGVENYCDILNDNKNPRLVAEQLATYLTERIANPTQEMLAYVANEQLQNQIVPLVDFSKKKSNKIVHL